MQKTRWKNLPLILLVCPAVIWPQWLIAKELESILVTANAPVAHSKGYLESLDIISEQDIARQQPLDIQQLLDGIEGLYASSEGGPGGVNSLTMRGAEPNFAVVLIDGVAVNDPTNTRGGSFDLATLSPGPVRRIEVIKGPRSLLYGSDALAGVVKVITAPDAGEDSGLQLNYESREYGAFQTAAEGGLANEQQALSLQASRDDSGDIWQDSERKLDERAVHYRVAFDQALIQLGTRRAEFLKSAYPEQSGGPEFAVSDRRDISGGVDDTTYISGDYSPLESWRIAVQYSEFERFLDYYSPGIAPYNNVPENFYTADYERQQWRVVSEHGFGNVNLNVGVDRRWESGVSQGQVVFSSVPVDALGFLLGLPSLPAETGLGIPLELALDTDYRLRRTTEGQFAELNWQSESGWVVSGGLRRDKADDYEETVRRYRLGVPVRNTRLSLSYSEGFKLPSFFALGHGLVGNPNLEPERVSSYELEWQAEWGGLNVELALFDTEYEDLIDFDAEAFTNVNRNRVTSRGGEIALQYRWSNWQLRGSISHVDIEVENSERRLANRPENTALFELNWQPNATLNVHSRVRWIDEQLATSLHSGETREYTLSDYSLWDTALHWRASSLLGVMVGVENLADTDYSEAVGFPGPGRLLRLGLQLSL